MNDLRFYDECLSPKQVREVYKTLVCHYKLNGENKGGVPNLLPETNMGIANWYNVAANGKYTKEPINFLNTNAVKLGCTISSTSWRMIMFQGKIVQNIDKYKGGEIYTVTYDTDGGAEIQFRALMNSDATHIITKENKLIKKEKKKYGYHYQYQFKMIDTVVADNQLVYFYHYLEEGQSLIITNLKIIKGDADTPWTPNEQDPLYSELGYDENIEYDCSGYGNDSTEIDGIIDILPDSPRYQSSSKMMTGKDYIKIPSPLPSLVNPTSKDNNQMTCSFWVKPSSKDLPYSTVVSNHLSPSTGFWIATNCEGSGLWVYFRRRIL